MTTTFNRLAELVGVLVVAGFGYAAGKAQSAPEKQAVQSGREAKEAARAARQKRKGAVKTPAPPAKQQPLKTTTGGGATTKLAGAGTRNRSESIRVYGNNFEDQATLTFADTPGGSGPTRTGTLGTDAQGTYLECVAPPHGVGSVYIRVTNQDGSPTEDESDTTILDYVEEPRIEVLSSDPSSVFATP
jgi:hypothetical protein